MIGTGAKIGAAALGAALLCMLVAGSFVGALHDPAPHGLPVGVVGTPSAARGLDAAFAAHAPGAFSVSAYPSATSARQAILTRAVDAALVPGPSGQRLLVAGATGRFVTQAVTAVFTAEAAAAGQRLTVTDIRPAPPGDPNGIAQFLFFIGVALPSAAFGVALATVLGRRSRGPAPATELPWPARLAALAWFALCAGTAAAWVADGMTGALPGAPAALVGMGALAAFAVSSAVCAAWRVAGHLLTALLVLLLIPVGLPAAGGPFGPAFVTSWYARLGAALPAGAALPTVRDIISFGGHALGSALLVLCLWAGISAIIVALPAPRLLSRRHGRRTESAPLLGDAGAASAAGVAG